MGNPEGVWSQAQPRSTIFFSRDDRFSEVGHRQPKPQHPKHNPPTNDRNHNITDNDNNPHGQPKGWRMGIKARIIRSSEVATELKTQNYLRLPLQQIKLLHIDRIAVPVYRQQNG
jgi:hypothetical protein